jgi:hypothetical protein
MQLLSNTTDGRINFNQPTEDILDQLYDLAIVLNPAQGPAAKTEIPAVTPVTPMPVAKTQAEYEADLAAAKKAGFEEAQKAALAEQSGGGIGSRGTGARRSTTTSKEAFQNMPLADLKRLIQTAG